MPGVSVPVSSACKSGPYDKTQRVYSRGIQVVSGSKSWRPFKAIDERWRSGRCGGRHRHIELPYRKPQTNNRGDAQREGARLFHQVLGRSWRVIQVDATVWVVVMMVGSAFEVQGCMRPMVLICQQNVCTCTGQTLPANAEHKDERGEQALHGEKYSGVGNGPAIRGAL